MTRNDASGAVNGAHRPHGYAALGRSALIGLGLFALLSLFDVVFTFVPASPGEVGPPVPIIVLGFVLGVVSLALIALVPRLGRVALLWLVGCRVLSALSGVPAFFVDGVPGWARIMVGVFCALTLVGYVLIQPGLAKRGAHRGEN